MMRWMNEAQHKKNVWDSPRLDEVAHRNFASSHERQHDSSEKNAVHMLTLKKIVWSEIMAISVVLKYFSRLILWMAKIYTKKAIRVREMERKRQDESQLTFPHTTAHCWLNDIPFIESLLQMRDARFDSRFHDRWWRLHE